GRQPRADQARLPSRRQPQTHRPARRHGPGRAAVTKRSRDRAPPSGDDSRVGTEGEIGEECGASGRRRAHYRKRTRILDIRLPGSPGYHVIMDHKGILYLSNRDVKKVLDLGRAIEITEQALRDHSEGRVIWSTPEDLAIKPAEGAQSCVPGCALAPQPVAGFRIRSIKAAGGSRDPSRPPEGPRRILVLSN